MKRILRLLVLVGVLVGIGAPSTGAAQAPTLDFEIRTHTLENGLRVVLQPDTSTPTVSIAVYYDVGARNEVPGRSGFAHLFEHMMFQGSANIEKGGHFQHINRNGGRMNGTTSEDRTNYFEILPSDRLALGLWLEADRMRSLDISAENFENQREVVKEERRLRVDNRPYIPAWLAFREHAYDAWEYAHSVIGSMDDLDAAELEDVQAFFDLWYAPNNAVLTLVGDFDPDEALGLVEMYFGSIPRGDQPPAVDIVEPAQNEYREVTAEDALATQPALIMAWHIPPSDHPDHRPLDLAARILAGGESSRLYERLVREDAIALETEAWLEGHRGPDLFTVWSIARDAAPEALRDAVLEEVARLLEDGIDPAELEAAKEQTWRDLVTSVETTLGRSLVIGRDALYFDDPGRINGEPDAVDSVTVEDVERVIRAYLVPENCDAMLIHTAAADSDASGDVDATEAR